MLTLGAEVAVAPTVGGAWVGCSVGCAVAVAAGGILVGRAVAVAGTGVGGTAVAVGGAGVRVGAGARVGGTMTVGAGVTGVAVAVGAGVAVCPGVAVRPGCDGPGVSEVGGAVAVTSGGRVGCEPLGPTCGIRVGATTTRGGVLVGGTLSVGTGDAMPRVGLGSGPCVGATTTAVGALAVGLGSGSGVFVGGILVLSLLDPEVWAGREVEVGAMGVQVAVGATGACTTMMAVGVPTMPTITSWTSADTLARTCSSTTFSLALTCWSWRA